MSKKALIIGILGQDGSFMADLLLSKGYAVEGICNPANVMGNEKYERFEREHPSVKIYWMDILTERDNFHSLLMPSMVRQSPDEIYNFAGVSNVFNPYENVDKTIDLNSRIPAIILEAIVKVNPAIRYFQASSCLIFGRDKSGMQNELTPLNPLHPYGVTKMCADMLIHEFRRVHNIFACSGIFFNHESERRDPRFFTRKVTHTLARIKAGLETELNTGNLDVGRDFGYAPDFMEASHLMLQNKEPKDYVIGTGKLISLHNWVRLCAEFSGVDLSVVKEDTKQVRTHETGVLCADYSQIKKDLGWEPRHSVKQMAQIMVNHDIKLLE